MCIYVTFNLEINFFCLSERLYENDSVNFGKKLLKESFSSSVLCTRERLFKGLPKFEIFVVGRISANFSFQYKKSC